jgi:hypothetical protein
MKKDEKRKLRDRTGARMRRQKHKEIERQRHVAYERLALRNALLNEKITKLQLIKTQLEVYCMVKLKLDINYFRNFVLFFENLNLLFSSPERFNSVSN